MCVRLCWLIADGVCSFEGVGGGERCARRVLWCIGRRLMID